MLNFNDKTLDKKERDIKSRYEATRFDNKIKIKTLEDIFENLFNQREKTYLVSTDKINCLSGKDRSYYAAYQLCMHYFPELSFKDMYHTLKSYNNDKWFSGFYTCLDVGRSVYQGGLNFYINK